jgi:hypothetical protein
LERVVWHLGNGLSLGSSLDQLERWNGRPFTFSGFDWDYGGNCSFEGGRLANLEGVIVTLEHTQQQSMSQKELEAIGGEQTLSSRNLTVRKSRPRVCEITVSL